MIEIATGKHPWYNDDIKDLDDLKRRMLREELPQIPEVSELATDFIRQCLQHHKS